MSISIPVPLPISILILILSSPLGVREHCQFLKQIEDASALRKAIAYCFERANIPNLTKQEIQDALSFVIVGAGPTGVIYHIILYIICVLLCVVWGRDPLGQGGHLII